VSAGLRFAGGNLPPLAKGLSGQIKLLGASRMGINSKLGWKCRRARMNELPPGRREREQKFALSWKWKSCAQVEEGLAGTQWTHPLHAIASGLGYSEPLTGMRDGRRPQAVACSWFPPSSSRRGYVGTSSQLDVSWFLDLESTGWAQVVGWRCDPNSSCRSRLLAEARKFPWLRRYGSTLPSGKVPPAGKPGMLSGKEGSSCVARWHRAGGVQRGPGGPHDAPRCKDPGARDGRFVSRWSCSMSDPGRAGPQLAGSHVSTRYAADE